MKKAEELIIYLKEENQKFKQENEILKAKVQTFEA